MTAHSFISLFFVLFFYFPLTLAAAPVISDGDVPSESGFRLVTVARGLEHPWSMAWLPNGDMLITERPGRLRLMRQGGLVDTPLSGLPTIFAGGQGGLLDVRLHPRFDENKKVYFTYAHGTALANRTRVAVASLNGLALDDWRVLFEVATPKAGGQHFGSRMAWLPDGTLLVSIGDGGNPPVRLDGDWIRKKAQSKGSRLGKIVRLTADGQVPADNPFPKSDSADPHIWSLGHRNIQGLAYDPLRDRVWASEHGALGGDELNQIAGGENYGWPTVTYSREYVGGVKISEHTSKTGMRDPEIVWMTAIAPSGLEIYTGDRFPQWRGDLFAGGLQSQDIRRIDLDAGGKVMGQTALRIGERVREVRQGPDGLLYVLTDTDAGRLLRIEPADGGDLPELP